MHKYRVVDCLPGESRLLLEGGVGHFHTARVLNDLPDVGTVLTGYSPHLGFGLLMSQQSGRAVRVIFQSINSTKRKFDSAG